MPLSFVRARSVGGVAGNLDPEALYYDAAKGWLSVPSPITVPQISELPLMPAEEKAHFDRLRKRGISEQALCGYYEADHLVGEALSQRPAGRYVVVSYLYTRPPDHEGIILHLEALPSSKRVKGTTTPIWAFCSKPAPGDPWWKRL